MVLRRLGRPRPVVAEVPLSVAPITFSEQ
jgi:hypothetical protein